MLTHKAIDEMELLVQHCSELETGREKLEIEVSALQAAVSGGVNAKVGGEIKRLKGAHDTETEELKRLLQDAQGQMKRLLTLTLTLTLTLKVK